MSQPVLPSDARFARGAALRVAFVAWLAAACGAEGSNPATDTVQAKAGGNSPANTAPAAVPDSLDNASLEGTRWTLVRVRADSVREGDYGREPFLTLADGRASGSGGCNSFSGGYELNGNGITFKPLAATKMACDKGMEREQVLLTSLGAVTSWRVMGRRLELYDASGGLMAAFVAVS
jgi:heat shock protein HslJ